ncbi:MAG: 3-hydroxyacyl-CoA dehydrogenase NAD-binding domain-containing protein [Sphingobium sp.]
MGQELNRIAVCGAGAMGSGIAQVAAQSGAQVIVFDIQPNAIAGSEKRILASIDGLVAKGKMTAEAAADIRGRMRWTCDLQQLADAELVIEAIVEDADIKGKLFEQLESTVGHDAILASNTSSLPIARLARSLKTPERFVGMHFFNPATVMKLVEVVAGPATSQSVAEAVRQTAQSWGKVAIPVTDVPGFIVNRVARPFYAEAFTALNEAAAEPATIDALFRAVGFRMGPLELTDLIGQDVNYAVGRSVYDSYFGRTRFVPQLKQAALVDAGWLGRKTGRGIYCYDDDALKPVPAAADNDVVLPDRARAADALKAAAPGTFIECAGVLLGMTRGRSAHAEAAVHGKPVALYDWFPADDGKDVAFSGSSAAAAAVLAEVLTAWSRSGRQIADRPGLIVCRTLAQLANAAADAVLEQVSDESGIDAALRYGANYPFGPFAWADGFDRGRLVAVLDAIADETGETMYRPSPYLRKFA